MYQGIAAAKINLTLAVLGRRPDGYHLLESVMQTLHFAMLLRLSWRLKPPSAAICQVYPVRRIIWPGGLGL